MIRVSERFFLGGNRLRGFEAGGVGARDLSTGDALGGTKFYRASTEVEVPLGLPDEFDIRGSIFTDIGSVWGNDDPFDIIADDASLRGSVGIGLGWASPAGPIRINLTRAYLKEDYDLTEFFAFQLRHPVLTERIHDPVESSVCVGSSPFRRWCRIASCAQRSRNRRCHPSPLSMLKG